MYGKFSQWSGTVFALTAGAALVWAGPPSHQTNDDTTIAQIRVQVFQIDRSEESLRKVERDLEGFSTEGGDLTGDFQGDLLVKMTARYFGESGKTSAEYYLRNGRPFFVLKTDYAYKSLLSQKVIRKEQMRFYWNRAGKLVRVLDNEKHALGPSSPEARQQEKDLIEAVPKLVALLRAPAKGAADPR